MRNLHLLVVGLGLLLSAGCRGEDRTARQYAQKLNVVLRSYQDQVNRKIAAEQEAYQRLAAAYAHDRDVDVRENLELERAERSQRVADALLKRGSSDPISPSELKNLLQGYGAYDFDQTRALLDREVAAETQYLAALESMEVETQKIQALSQALDDLAKPKSRAQQFKDLAAFADQVNQEFDKLVCADLAEEIKRLQGKLEAVKALPDSPDKTQQIGILEEQIKRLQERRKQMKCAD
jgi:hypothetical protein